MIRECSFFRVFTMFILTVSLATVGAEEKSPLELSLTTDAAYYPESDYKASSGGTHFAPITGAFSGAELCTTFEAAYKMPFLAGSSELTEDNSLAFSLSLELTPVSVAPGLCVTFSPIAFLELYGGCYAGTGWELAGLLGTAEYSLKDKEYTGLDPFSAWKLYGYGGATLMFDTGAIWEGDWNHVVMSATYEVGYQKLTGKDCKLWGFQESYGQADGLVFDQYYLIGYQMPLPLSLVGVALELSGHYDADDYGDWAHTFGGSFVTAEVGPVCEFTLGPRDTLSLLAQFATRRAFSASHDEANEEPLLEKTGTEWYFERIAASWKHIF